MPNEIEQLKTEIQELKAQLEQFKGLNELDPLIYQTILSIVKNHIKNDMILDDVSNVVLSSPTNAQVIKYQTSNNTWVNANDLT